MMGAARPATPAVRADGRTSAALFDHPGLAQSLVVGGALPLGAFGAYRLLRPFATSSLPGIAAAAAYAANPIARNAIWRGELGPLVCFAVGAVRVRRVRAGHRPGERFRPGRRCRSGDQSAGRRFAPRSRLHTLCSVALLVAVAGSVWPPALLLAPVLAVAYCLALPFAGGVHRAALAVGGAVAASSPVPSCSRRGRSR